MIILTLALISLLCIQPIICCNHIILHFCRGMDASLRTLFIATLFILLLNERRIKAANILVIPADNISNINFFTVAAKILQDDGHNVTVLSVDRHKKLIDGYDVPNVLLKTVKGVNPAESEEFEQHIVKKEGVNLMQMYRTFTEITSAFHFQCQEMLENKEIMAQLTEATFDLAIVDGIDIYRCAYIFPYKLGISYITLSGRHDAWGSNVPAMPSLEPAWPVMHSEDDPSFFYRVKSLMVYMVVAIITSIPPFDTSLLVKHAPEKPATTYQELFLDSEMYLINLETTCMDYHRIEAPHYKFVSGMASHPAEPLSKEMNDYVNEAEHGIIVVTFGSLVKRASTKIIEKMMTAFERVKQRVLMRYDGPKISNKPDNVRLEKWLPQNDLLGNDKTLLFITHAGNNGQLESLYHGIPMLCMPFVGDQGYNSALTKNKGYGLVLDPFEFTPDELYDTIQELVYNTSYKKAIQHCSNIIHDMPDAKEKLTFYVNHILRFGGEHLKSPHIRMPLYKVFMLDVMAFFLVIMYVVYRVCKFVFYAMYNKCIKEQKMKND